MTRALLAFSLLLAPLTADAYARSAFWTGRQESTTTVTYQPAIRCQYQLDGRTFWMLFVREWTCPYSVEVE